MEKNNNNSQKDISSLGEEKNSHSEFEKFNNKYLIFNDYQDDIDCYLNSSTISRRLKKNLTRENKSEKNVSNLIFKINNNSKNSNNKFNPNNFQNIKSNKFYNEKTENSFNLKNNQESNNTLGNHIIPQTINSSNINNFYIINNTGPCTFPITQNITNYGNMTNQTINENSSIKKDYKIQKQNFNILNQDEEDQGNLNDCHNSSKQNINFNNNLQDNFRVFDEKNNFIQDKTINNYNNLISSVNFSNNPKLYYFPYCKNIFLIFNPLF